VEWVRKRKSKCVCVGGGGQGGVGGFRGFEEDGGAKEFGEGGCQLQELNRYSLSQLCQSVTAVPAVTKV